MTSPATSTLVVTGANRGIGLELVRRFLADGAWRIHAACRAPESAMALADLAAGHPDRLTVHPLDVTDAGSVVAFAEALGEAPVDLLINNAGVLNPHQALDDLDFAAWERELQVNTLAPMRMAVALRPQLRRAANPRIVTISSQMGSLARPRGGSYAYRSSKAAVNKAMQGLAIDLEADGICVVVMHPGWVRTSMGGGSAEIDPQESAAGIFSVATRLSMADTGSFLQWNGEIHPW
ncbi:SDR family oxidoreductase [Stappia sp. P2PMeth1]|uniref:SDR family oxidoreductase n=1 Tax=Stappia sp. P2PMeth1 TaxID=2003586 RepID=UPI001647BF80|nr:SDR family oxidoreductase [Stappia sp. P2PMeth1]